MYERFEHRADIGICEIVSTPERTFEEATKVMFDVEVDVEKVRPTKKW